MSSSYIAMNYKCNHNCICCPLSTYDRLHGAVDYEHLKLQILNIAKKTDELKHFIISGGEPTLDPNFFNLLKLLSSIDANIVVLSNASTCEDMDFVKKIIDSLGPDYDLSKFEYVTAIHSMNPIIHEKITSTPGSLSQTLKGLDNLVDAKIHLTIKNIMNKLTYLDMNKTFKKLSEMYSKEVDYQFCSMDFIGKCKKHLEELLITFPELKPYFEETLDSIEGNVLNRGREISIYETPLCAVDPYYWKYYKIHNNILNNYIAPNEEKEYNKSEDRESNCNTNHEICNQCDVKEFCCGVWQSTYEILKNKREVINPVKVLKKEYY